MPLTSMDEIAKFAAQKYDYVIIGGGTAGLVVAARLTEDPLVKVAVIEAGGNKLEDFKINTPAMITSLYEDPAYDWAFKTVPQPNLNDRIIAVPRGKMLGGSSGINFMMASHATKVELDSWEELGNPGWNNEELQPYYRKSETFTPSNDLNLPGASIIDPELHGTSGPLQTRVYPEAGELDKAWAPTFRTLGLEATEDARKGSTLGGYNVLMFMDQQKRRSYAASAYFAPIQDRDNLFVLTNAFVKKIVFDDKHDPKVWATGVVVSVAGNDFFINAMSEVILSAGTIQSPQILEISGIGGRSLLEQHGIKVIIENQGVGENLQDHALLTIGWEVVDGVKTAETLKQPGILDWAMKEYSEGRGGPLATGVGGTAFLSYSSVIRTLGEERTDVVELSHHHITSNSEQGHVQRQIFFNEQEADLRFNFVASGVSPYCGDRLKAFFTHTDPANYAGIGLESVHPFSRGTIHIQSSDPYIQPLIDPRYYSHPLDLELMTDGLLFAQKLSETKPMSNFLKERPNGKGKIIQPTFDVNERLTRARVQQLARDATISAWHHVGTCSMLPQNKGGVVDPKLIVYGSQNLRVVDASIIPLLVRGNIASAVYAVAEKAADLIKEQRYKPSV